MPAVSPYFSIRERLVAQTHEPENEQACWVWRAHCDRGGYPRFNLWVPGLQKHVKLMAHVCMLIFLECGPLGPDDLYLHYVEFRLSGLEADHLCVNPPCIRSDHLEPTTRSENCKRRGRYA